MKREGMPNIIETNRLYLSRPTSSDSLALGDLWRCEKIRAFLGGTISEDMISEKLTTLHKHWDTHGFGLWAVWVKATQDLAGLCGLHHSKDGLEISYMLLPSYWGQGLAREAARASLDYGIAELKEKSIVAITQEANLRSCRLLEAIGMKHIQTFTRFCALQRLYEMTRHDYKII